MLDSKRGLIARDGWLLGGGVEPKTFQQIGTDVLTVVEREQIVTILKEHKLGLENILDPETAKRVGRILGVDAIVTGSVTLDLKSSRSGGKERKTFKRAVTASVTMRVIAVEKEKLEKLLSTTPR